MSTPQDEPDGAPGSPGEMRLQAGNCLAVARVTDGAALRLTLLAMAALWLQRAQAAESRPGRDTLSLR